MGLSDPLAPSTGKRKRNSFEHSSASSNYKSTLQIVTGSYERVLHGFTASINTENSENEIVKFSDSFLVNAHTSAIRCLGLSPPSGSKRILASGSTDERINIYQLSNQEPEPVPLERASITKPGVQDNLANVKSRELGSLMHHSAPITSLCFSSRSNLISTASDNTIAITRTKDWTMLQMLKAPIPKAVGRPSGDTAGPGEIPAGINDIAIHPSAKVMLTVGKGERCMRSWDMIRGKKAEVLSFEKPLLRLLGEGRGPGCGEGRKITWDPTGEEFAVGFEWGAAIFGLDSRVKGLVRPQPAVKIHQMQYLHMENDMRRTLALSTEDGRILFYCTENSPESSSMLSSPPATPTGEISKADIPLCPIIAQLGGEVGLMPRIRVKDFIILPPISSQTHSFVITASSDGTARVWLLYVQDLKDGGFNGSPAQVTKESKSVRPDAKDDTLDDVPAKASNSPRRVGRLLGTYETGNRITCLAAFVMEPRKLVL